MEEIWKEIKGLEGKYLISSFGRVKSLSRNVICGTWLRKTNERILKNNIGTNGYYYVVIGGKTRYIHKLVSDAFLENTYKLSDVDHINENKLDNRIENLRYLSHFENSSKSNKGKYRRSPAFLGNNPKAKKVYAYSNEGEIKNIYDCAKEIAIEFGINYSTLKNKLKRDILYINQEKYTYNEIIT